MLNNQGNNSVSSQDREEKIKNLAETISGLSMASDSKGQFSCGPKKLEELTGTLKELAKKKIKIDLLQYVSGSEFSKEMRQKFYLNAAFLMRIRCSEKAKQLQEQLNETKKSNSNTSGAQLNIQLEMDFLAECYARVSDKDKETIRTFKDTLEIQILPSKKNRATALGLHAEQLKNQLTDVFSQPSAVPQASENAETTQNTTLDAYTLLNQTAVVREDKDITEAETPNTIPATHILLNRTAVDGKDEDDEIRRLFDEISSLSIPTEVQKQGELQGACEQIQALLKKYPKTPKKSESFWDKWTQELGQEKLQKFGLNAALLVVHVFIDKAIQNRSSRVQSGSVVSNQELHFFEQCYKRADQNGQQLIENSLENLYEAEASSRTQKQQDKLTLDRRNLLKKSIANKMLSKQPVAVEYSSKRFSNQDWIDWAQTVQKMKLESTDLNISQYFDNQLKSHGPAGLYNLLSELDEKREGPVLLYCANRIAKDNLDSMWKELLEKECQGVFRVDRILTFFQTEKVQRYIQYLDISVSKRLSKSAPILNLNAQLDAWLLMGPMSVLESYHQLRRGAILDVCDSASTWRLISDQNPLDAKKLGQLCRSSENLENLMRIYKPQELLDELNKRNQSSEVYSKNTVNMYKNLAIFTRMIWSRRVASKMGIAQYSMTRINSEFDINSLLNSPELAKEKEFFNLCYQKVSRDGHQQIQQFRDGLLFQMNDEFGKSSGWEREYQNFLDNLIKKPENTNQDGQNKSTSLEVSAQRSTLRSSKSSVVKPESLLEAAKKLIEKKELELTDKIALNKCYLSLSPKEKKTIQEHISKIYPGTLSLYDRAKRKELSSIIMPLIQKCELSPLEDGSKAPSFKVNNQVFIVKADKAQMCVFPKSDQNDKLNQGYAVNYFELNRQEYARQYYYNAQLVPLIDLVERLALSDADKKPIKAALLACEYKYSLWIESLTLSASVNLPENEINKRELDLKTALVDLSTSVMEKCKQKLLTTHSDITKSFFDLLKTEINAVRDDQKDLIHATTSQTTDLETSVTPRKVDIARAHNHAQKMITGALRDKKLGDKTFDPGAFCDHEMSQTKAPKIYRDAFKEAFQRYYKEFAAYKKKKNDFTFSFDRNPQKENIEVIDMQINQLISVYQTAFFAIHGLVNIANNSIIQNAIKSLEDECMTALNALLEERSERFNSLDDSCKTKIPDLQRQEIIISSTRCMIVDPKEHQCKTEDMRFNKSAINDKVKIFDLNNLRNCLIMLVRIMRRLLSQMNLANKTQRKMLFSSEYSSQFDKVITTAELSASSPQKQREWLRQSKKKS